LAFLEHWKFEPNVTKYVTTLITKLVWQTIATGCTIKINIIKLKVRQSMIYLDFVLESKQA